MAARDPAGKRGALLDHLQNTRESAASSGILEGMTTIKGPGPQLHVPVGSAPAATVTRAKDAATPVSTRDGFEDAAGARTAGVPVHATPVTGSVVSGLALIGSLRRHPLFGTGARTKPLKPGEQSLGDHDLDAALLAVDLASDLEQDLADPGSDANRRAAIAALFAGYPGGRDALAPIVS
jgi:hypothetical protein